jgi:crotonobetainyl-CoA:carnitine CoA-transferase CaiB-like acyl-CoA transferase
MADVPMPMLAGYKVLDFTQALAGPTTTRYLGQMGAEVIKIEIAPGGDLVRGFPFMRDGRSAYYVQQNRGKKSLCLDPKKAAGLAILKELIPKMDVLIQNFAPGVIERMGLGDENVRALNPRIVMCSISSLGRSGRLANLPGYDYVGAAYSGVLDMTGFPDRTPVFPQVGLGDISTGVHAMGAILAALLYRERTGIGQHVEASLLDSYFSYHDLNVHAFSASHGAIRPQRSGSHHFLVCPAGIFQGKQRGILILAMLDHQFPLLCRAMGRADLASDPRFKDIASRATNAEELKRIVQEWINATPSDDAVLQLLEEHRVPHAPVLTVAEAIAHAHLRDRGTVTTIEDRFIGQFDVPGFPLRFSAFPDEPQLPAPILGQHNTELLRDYLGYSAERIALLEAEGILHRGNR